MSEYKDRGILKWSPFDALDGHGSMIEEMIFNINKKQKNSLSDDEYEELNKTIKNAFENNKKIAIDYYNNGYTYQTFGCIKKLDCVKKVIILDTLEEIEFESLLQAKIVR